jgi:Mycothiol maleylpyruvate isomerase N-terminal domain
MTLSDRPADRHRQVAGLFTERVGHTQSWDAPSPVAGWAARDVVRHLTEWFPAFDQFYTADVFMHTWDLSRATGQDDRLDPGFCAQLLGGMEQMEEVIRGSGQYGPRVEVPGDADTQTRLLGFIGRDPFWPRR